MKIRILGCGEAFDSCFGNNSSLLFGEGRSPTLLIDCGYQIPERLWKLSDLGSQLDGIYLTHLHADHSFGIVPLLTRFWEERRKRSLRIFGPRGVEKWLRRLMDFGYPGIQRRLGFGLEWTELDANQAVHWKSLKLSVARSIHSVLNLSVRVDWGSNRSRKAIGISGDGQMSHYSRDLFEDVDLLLHEAYTEKPLIPTHADLETLADFVGKSRVRRVGITHISRMHRNQVTATLKALRRRDPRWFLAKPGMEIEL